MATQATAIQAVNDPGNPAASPPVPTVPDPGNPVANPLASPALARRAVAVMTQLNLVGAEIAEGRLARAATDVTGFGLLGHLRSLCLASAVGAELSAAKVPVLAKEVFDLVQADCIPGGSRENLRWADTFTQWAGVTARQRILLADAQTSGGLLLCVRPTNLETLLKLLKRHRTPCAAVIGRIVRSARPVIRVVP